MASRRRISSKVGKEHIPDLQPRGVRNAKNREASHVDG